MVWTPLKNISQLGWLFPIYGKIKKIPNHQPDHELPINISKCLGTTAKNNTCLNLSGKCDRTEATAPTYILSSPWWIVFFIQSWDAKWLSLLLAISLTMPWQWVKWLTCQQYRLQEMLNPCLVGLRRRCLATKPNKPPNAFRMWHSTLQTIQVWRHHKTTLFLVRWKLDQQRICLEWDEQGASQSARHRG